MCQEAVKGQSSTHTGATEEDVDLQPPPQTPSNHFSPHETSKHSTTSTEHSDLSTKGVVTIASDDSPKGVPSQHYLSIPATPTLALQFQMDWKSLRRDDVSLVKDFKAGGDVMCSCGSYGDEVICVGVLVMRWYVGVYW